MLRPVTACCMPRQAVPATGPPQLTSTNPCHSVHVCTARQALLRVNRHASSRVPVSKCAVWRLRAFHRLHQPTSSAEGWGPPTPRQLTLPTRTTATPASVVSEIKHGFTMTVTLPLSASGSQTYEGARHLRHISCREHAGRIRRVECHPVVTPALTHQEECWLLRHRFRHEPSGEVLDRPKSRLASKRLLLYFCGTLDLGLNLRTHNMECTSLTVFTDSVWASDRPTRKSHSS